MALYLSDEWHALARSLAHDLPERVGASVRIAYLVGAAPDGDRRYYVVIEDGRVIDQANGECVTPDITITISWADSVQVQTGELDATAAVMQGRLKVSGNMAKLMALMPLTATPAYKAIQVQVRAITEF